MSSSSSAAPPAIARSSLSSSSSTRRSGDDRPSSRTTSLSTINNNLSVPTTATLQQIRTSPLLPNHQRQLKAKIQLSELVDYQQLLRILRLHGAPVRTAIVQQEFILDSIQHDLWNAGLTISIRHSAELFPRRQTNPICTIVLKETIFKDFVGVNGELLNVDPSQTPFYEVKESEESVPLVSMVEVLSGAVITPQMCGNSQILQSVVAKYFVPGGIHCIGGFVNVRHLLQWNSLALEVDKCKFPFGEGYFVRFDPDDSTVLQLLTLLNENRIKYVFNLTSKTALFFHGLNPTSLQGQLPVITGHWNVDLPNGNSLDVALDDLFSATLTPGVQGDLADSWLNVISDANNHASTSVAPSSHDALHTVWLPHHNFQLHNVPQRDPVNGTGQPMRRSARVASSTPVPSISSSSSSAAAVASTSTHHGHSQPPKRGRKSLYDKIVEKSSKGELITERDLPEKLASTLGELDVDVSKLEPTQVPSVLKRYQQKRSSEASKRYRRKKNGMLDETRQKLLDVERELEHYKNRCQELEKELEEWKGAAARNGD